MVLQIEFYKLHPETYTAGSAAATEVYQIHRLIITAFDSLNINLGTPISPMPLPEDNAEGNILVKMEGNTKQVRCSFKLDTNLISLAYVKSIGLGDLRSVDDEGVVDSDKDGNDHTYTAIEADDNLEFIDTILKEFESRSITDTFFFRLKDTSNSNITNFGRGSISSIDTSVDSSSPVVWNCNIDYLVGDVISIYDADVPTEPKNFSPTALQDDPSPPNLNINKLQFVWSDPDRSGGSGFTNFTLHWTAIEGTLGQGETKHNSLTIPYTTSGSTGSFPLYNSGTGLYTKVLRVQDGAKGDRVYSCYMTAANVSGNGEKTKRIKVVTQAGA